MTIDIYDAEHLYCRKLGHPLAFGYCRTENRGSPCSRVLDCWFEKIPIEDFIMAHYDEKERTRIFTPPQEKITSLIDLIRNAQKSNGQ